MPINIHRPNKHSIMAELNEKQVRAIVDGLNEELRHNELSEMVGNLQAAYMDYTRLLVRDMDNCQPYLEVVLMDFGLLIQVLQKAV